MHALRLVPPRAAFAVSPSQLKSLDQCERAWYLASVARAPDDDTAGGQYLLQGDLYDEACQRHQAKLDVEVSSLVEAVRAKPGLRGAALTLPEQKWLELAERAQRMLRATERFLPTPKTAKIQHRYRVPVPGYEDRGGVVITGTCDFRGLGVVWDTKTTADRGPGRGRDAQTPPYALDATSLAADVQALTYAWCEFMLDPLRATVQCVWVYVSKASPASPSGWAVTATFARYDVLAWFASYVRPRLDRMIELHLASEIELDAGLAHANHDSCGRCFRRGACDPFTGLQAHFRGEADMVDFAKLRARQGGTSAVAFGAQSFHAPTPPREAVYAALVADAAATTGGTQDDRRADVEPPAINRPDAPPNPNAPKPGDRVVVFGSTEPRQLLAAADFPIQSTSTTVVDTTGVEAAAPLPPPGAAETVLALLTPDGRQRLADASTPEADGTLTTATLPAVPKRGRGRPRRHPQQHEADGSVQDAAPVIKAAAPSIVALVAAAAPLADASGLDGETLERLATAWQRIADAADAAVAVVNAELRARGVAL